jgi:hypothetical protein
MQKLIIAFAISMLVIACEKDVSEPNINVEGYWMVLNDTTFTSIKSNDTSNLYHLFRGNNAYYRLAYSKNADFTNLSLRPNKDSAHSFYQVVGSELMLSNHAASFNTNVGGNVLLSQTGNQMVFTRYVVERRSAIDGKVIKDRTDTIRYNKVTDPTKVAYFDNYLKTYF